MSLFKFLRSNKAIAALEVALALPVLMLLFAGGFEMTRYIIIQTKIAKTVASVSDLVSRSPELFEVDITNTFSAVPYMLEPYYNPANVRVHIYSVGNYGSGSIVNWVRSGGGTYAGAATVGAQNGAATLTSGFTLASNEETIIAEIYYNYTPIFAPNIVGSQVIRKLRYTKPRLGALNQIKP